MIAVTSFEATTSVFNITNENNSFSFSIPGYWTSREGTGTIIQLREILELRAENDIEINVKEMKKRGNHMKIGSKGNKLSYRGTHKISINEESKNEEYSELEDMVVRLELTYNKLLNILDMKYIDA